MSYRIGPARLLSAPTMGTPADEWMDHGEARGAVTLQHTGDKVATGRIDRLGRAPYVGAIHAAPIMQEITAPLLEEQIQTLQHVIPGSVVFSEDAAEALGMPVGTSTLTPRAFALAPLEAWKQGAWTDDPATRWLFHAYALVTGALADRQLPEGDDVYSDSAYEVQVVSVAKPGAAYGGGIGPVHIAGGVTAPAVRTLVYEPDGQYTTAAAGQEEQLGAEVETRAPTAFYGYDLAYAGLNDERLVMRQDSTVYAYAETSDADGEKVTVQIAYEVGGAEHEYTFQIDALGQAGGGDADTGVAHIFDGDAEVAVPDPTSGSFGADGTYALDARDGAFAAHLPQIELSRASSAKGHVSPESLRPS